MVKWQNWYTGFRVDTPYVAARWGGGREGQVSNRPGDARKFPNKSEEMISAVNVCFRTLISTVYFGAIAYACSKCMRPIETLNYWEINEPMLNISHIAATKLPNKKLNEHQKKK